MLTKEQLALRKLGLGGSEMAGVVGMNKYMAPIDVWRSKCDPTYEVAVTPPMERGDFLEDGIARWYAHRTGAELRDPGTLVHPSKELTIVRCTPDRIAKLSGSEVDLSVKSPGPWTQSDWGEPGTDEIPEAYLIQVQWELIILEALHGIRHAHVVAPLGNDLGIYNVRADANLQGYLLEAGKKFWNDFVLTQKPPPIDGSESCSKWVKGRFPKNTDKLVEATSEADELMRQLYETRMRAEEIELEKEALNSRLQELCGNHEGMIGRGWKLSWKNTKGSIKTDWEGVANELGVPDEVLQRHTRITAGSRRFLPTWEKPKESK